MLNNAIKHAPEDSTVDVFIEPETERVLIHIKNQGKTIPPAEISKVFDRFYRSRDSGNHGTGLGLAIAKSIAKAHGGNIEVYSAENTTCFTLSLPR
jgi:signal transduction histidine kinase